MVILSGYNAGLFSGDTPPPTILFTWLNPAFTPESVKIVFDDSPLGIVSETARGKIPPRSDTSVIVSRLASKRDLAKLAKALAAKRP
jgi:hypothetical protein